MKKIHDEEAMLLAYGLQKILVEQQRKIALQNQASLVRHSVHSIYPICGGVSDFSQKDRFAYCKADLYPNN